MSGPVIIGIDHGADGIGRRIASPITRVTKNTAASTVFLGGVMMGLGPDFRACSRIGNCLMGKPVEFRAAILCRNKFARKSI